jgi:hypothetical protein
MPFLVWHSSLGSSVAGSGERAPQKSSRKGVVSVGDPSSATSQKCPPITSCPSIISTTCVEPDVSLFQTRLPSALENSAM